MSLSPPLLLSRTVVATIRHADKHCVSSLCFLLCFVRPTAGCPRPQELDQGPLGPWQGRAQPLTSFETAVCVSSSSNQGTRACCPLPVEPGDESMVSPTCGWRHHACWDYAIRSPIIFLPCLRGKCVVFFLGGKGAPRSPPSPPPPFTPLRSLFSACFVLLASGMAAYLF